MRGQGVRFTSSFSTRTLFAAIALVAASPASAQYYDIYGAGNRNLAAAQSAYDAMGDAPSDVERARLVSDLIMGLIGKAKYREAYDLYLANATLDLSPDAVAGAVGDGLVAFVPEEDLQAVYVAKLKAMVDAPSCAPCYARTFSAHHLARYFYLREDNLDKSIEWHKRALDLAKVDLDPSDPARVNFAYQYAAYLRNKDLEASKLAMRETEAMAFELLPSDDHLGWLYVSLGNALLALDGGRKAEAIDLFSRIADIGVKEWGENDPQLISIYQNIAILMSQLGRTEQAVEVAQRAEANEGYSDERELGYHRALIARLLFQDARPDEAIGYYRLALSLFDGKVEDETTLARAQTDLATALSVTGGHGEAMGFATQALAIYQKLDPTTPQRRNRQMDAALIFARAGDIGRAVETMQPVLEANENALLDLYASEQDRLAIASDGTALFRDSTLIALLSDDLERAWRSAQLSVISDLTLSAAALSYPGDADGFSAALNVVRSARSAEAEARLQLAGGEGSAQALADAVAQREGAQATLQLRYPDFADFLRPRPLSIADAVSMMGQDEAYILPLVYPDRVVTIAITAKGLEWDQAQTDLFSTRDLIESVRTSLDAGLGGEDAFAAGAAHDLYMRIFSNRVREAVKGKRKLIFPAGGPLASIPPSVLVTTPPSSGENPAFLIRDHAIAITPGFGQRIRSRPSAAKQFAGIGAPSLAPAPADRAALRGVLIDVASVAALPSLPGAQRELDALQAAFAAEDTLILSGNDATEAAVRAAPLSDYRVLAFATHGLVSGQISGLTEPALVMTPQTGEAALDNDGLLTASEIARLDLAADWIILSACNTAAGEGPDTPTYSGLARAFQLAGARSLLLSHWPVRDDAATRLSVATVMAARNGMARSEALRQAQLALIDDATIAGGASPSIWAPFVLIE